MTMILNSNLQNKIINNTKKEVYNNRFIKIRLKINIKQ